MKAKHTIHLLAMILYLSSTNYAQKKYERSYTTKAPINNFLRQISQSSRLSGKDSIFEADPERVPLGPAVQPVLQILGGFLTGNGAGNGLLYGLTEGLSNSAKAGGADIVVNGFNKDGGTARGEDRSRDKDDKESGSERKRGSDSKEDKGSGEGAKEGGSILGGLSKVNEVVSGTASSAASGAASVSDAVPSLPAKDTIP